MEINIHISNDEKQAFLNIISEKEKNEKEPTIDELKQALAEKGIVAGIKEIILEEICTRRMYNTKIFVAEGLPPQIGEESKIQIKIMPKDRPTYDKGLDVEKQINHYGEKEGFITFVKEGTLLATRIPPTRGQNGQTVTGKEIQGLLGKDASWSEIQGRNTKLVENNLIATKDGILKKEDLKLNVDQNIVIEHDLGIKTGSIVLPLDADIDLYVQGDIKSGFMVQCRKITVMGSIEDAKVIAKILEVKKGIVGASDKPIVADNLETGFIIGMRKIIGKFVNVKQEISGGSKVQADFVRSHVIQESSITARYGVWADYLYGQNTICVGIDVSESEKYHTWIANLKDVKQTLEEIKNSNMNALRKVDSVKEMAKRMPNNPSVQKEYQKINEILIKIKNIENMKAILEKNIEQHMNSMYIAGSPFILVRFGFARKTLMQEKPQPVNEFIIKEFKYEKSKSFVCGLYTLKDAEVIADSNYDFKKLTELAENYKMDSLN